MASAALFTPSMEYRTPRERPQPAAWPLHPPMDPPRGTRPLLRDRPPLRAQHPEDKAARAAVEAHGEVKAEPVVAETAGGRTLASSGSCFRIKRCSLCR